MKICYLTHNIDPKNGWGRYASDLISGVEKAGHNAAILKEADDGFRGESVLRRGWGIFLSSLKVRKYVKDCDIIHALDIYPYGIIAWLSNLFVNKKFVITAQGTYSIAPLHNPKTSRLAKLTYQAANQVIAISNYTEKEILKKVKLNNVLVINHGIDLEKFYGERLEAEENFILSVGALKYRKGYHISILAFAKVKGKIPNLKYKIVGSQKDKNYFDYLKKIILEYGLGEDIIFLKDISDEELRKLYQRAKIFVLTPINEGYHIEGFGLVYLEAAAAGLPVIGTFGNGAEDAINNGKNGILVSQNDTKKTAEAVEKIISDTGLQFETSQESYKWASEHKLNNVISEYVNLYSGLINDENSKTITEI